MAIGPDGRIIRRRVRFFTPINTQNPSGNTGFLIGLASVMILPVILMIIFALIGWLGDFFISWTWWKTSNFVTAGFFVSLLVFPIFIAGVLEGLARVNYSRFKWYAFLYGTIAFGILIFVSSLSEENFNYYNYLWALAYGIYSLWVAKRNVR